jgi:HlyD family secretion protein
MKSFWALVIILGLGAGGYFWWSKDSAKETAANPAARATTATVEKRDIQFAVNAAGDIGPADQVSVRPEVNGRIAELPVDIGDKVAKDALLCRLDDRDLQIERQQQLDEMSGARLQLQKAERAYERNKQLFADRLVATEIYEDSRTDFELATNALMRASSALRLVDDHISKTKILAPFDCTVLTRPVSVGQAVSGSGGFNSGSEVMTIANLNDMIINAHINQADVTRLSAGQDVEIQVESVPGLKMRGLLDRVAPQAVIRNGIKGFAARITIKDIDPRVRPGMTAILSIPIASVEDVLAVPLASVFTEENGRYVFVKTGEKFERRTVVIGITDYGYAEVQQGLSAGEVVSLEQVADTQPPVEKTAAAGIKSRFAVTKAALSNAVAPATVKFAIPTAESKGGSTKPENSTARRNAGSGS